jgi:hypothetical protein
MQIKNEETIHVKLIKGKEIVQGEQHQSFSPKENLIKISERKIKSRLILK